jgi:hypothetical protein
VTALRRSLSEAIADTLPTFFFWACWAAAGVLLALVFASPALDSAEEHPAGWQRPIAVFARDAAMRRTAIGAALGMAVTACVFFRSPRVPRPPRMGPGSSSSGPVIGA